jgi:2Fe-2S ferredoxin
MCTAEIVMQQRAVQTPDDIGKPTLSLVVSLPDGGRFELPALEGARIMDLIRGFGFPVKSGCEGTGVCSDCHVQISALWRGRLAPPSRDEIAKLAHLPDAGPSSRLACRLLMTAALDGLELDIHPHALVPQTYWVAG